ncbi:ELM1/GtrOC1 family putative glycosyltransferase [Microbulbifer hainanensis]|uniref:ELM1/GtrOC1 family putative glycosyltransferase n=1 Tax=Microbulbifer hainanensis TaxID=2735675 RepID=UPI001D00E9D3|nr:ELM1/GtrOC1 family putative glycosyltransferase [Microbulbifer hainanensis]
MRLTVWRFLDGNRAHEKQSAALLAGLRECVDEVTCCEIREPGSIAALRPAFANSLRDLPRPDLLFGAGRRSHWPVVLAKRWFGGTSVAINRPTLPIRWFDYAIVPEHDRPPALENVILSQGALTEPLPHGQTQRGTGLLLLGGPSKHFRWDDAVVERQLAELLAMPVDWVVSDSRRTPAGALNLVSASRAQVQSWRDCPPDWLPQQLARVEQVWVTGDSISMVFEALQSKARVGVLQLPSRNRINKVRGAMQRLVDQGMVTDRIADAAQPWAGGREPLNQYLLCARALLRRCADDRGELR